MMALNQHKPDKLTDLIAIPENPMMRLNMKTPCQTVQGGGDANPMAFC